MIRETIQTTTPINIRNYFSDYQTPFIVINIQKLRENCRRFKKAFPSTRIYFAVKANNHPGVLKIFRDEGLNFDVASWGEIQMLSGQGICTDRMAFNAPTKIPHEIKRAYLAGVKNFTFDSAMEIEKIAALAPGSNVMARIEVDKNGSFYPLDQKFGMNDDEACDTLCYAKKFGLIPYGLTFHVGSQNTDPDSWIRAMRRIATLREKLQSLGLDLPVVDIGGGYPVCYNESIPEIEEIAERINKASAEFFGKEVEIWVEPGRSLVSDAAVLVTSVINRARRGKKEWLYLDSGVFHGLIETWESIGFEFPILTNKDGGRVEDFVLAGPTCDSGDVISRRSSLPENLTLGDRLYFLNAGAYTNSMEVYNGIPFPEVLLSQE